jgi:hypothetical protein
MPNVRPTAALAAAVVLLCGPGCGDSGGPSDYDKMMAGRKGAADSLAQAGAKVQEKQYPVGKGWAVDLRGLTVTEDLLKQVKQLGIISEMDLGRSTVNDALLGKMKELELLTLLARLDLSHTAVTDAGLDRLDGFIFLSHLDLTGTGVTPAAVDRFKQRRLNDPKARVKTTTVKR